MSILYKNLNINKSEKSGLAYIGLLTWLDLARWPLSKVFLPRSFDGTWWLGLQVKYKDRGVGHFAKLKIIKKINKSINKIKYY